MICQHICQQQKILCIIVRVLHMFSVYTNFSFMLKYDIIISADITTVLYVLSLNLFPICSVYFLLDEGDKACHKR